MDDGISVSRTSVGPAEEATRIYTTRRVLDNILAGNITFQKAVEQGLIASSCGIECSGEPYGPLRIALEFPRQKAELGLN